MREFLKKVRQYRWVMWTIGAVAAVLRLAWFIFSHYSWLVGIAAMIGAALGEFYSPAITNVIIAGLLALAAVRVLGWQARLAWDSSQVVPPPKPVEAVEKPAQLPKVSAGSLQYHHWDLLDPLAIWQASALWAGIDPTRYPDGTSETYPIKQALKAALLSKKIPNFKGAIPASALLYNRPEEVPNEITITREDLRNFAESLDQRPWFLFPDERF